MNIFHQTRGLFSRVLLLVGLGMLALGLAPSAKAQTLIYKKNNVATLSSNTNWSTTSGGGTSPTAVNATEIGIFDNTVASGNVAQVTSANFIIGGLRVLNPGGALTINGTGAAVRVITLGNSGFTNGGGIDMSSATQNLSILSNISITMANAQSWVVGNGTTSRTLTVNGTIATGGFVLTLDGNGTVAIGGVNGTITGTGGLTIGNSSLTANLSGINTFTGNTTFSAGTLTISGNRALQASTLNFTGGTIGFGALNNATIGGLAGTSNIIMPTSFALTINAAAADNDVYSGVLSGTSATVTSSGAGTQTLSGNNSYTGLTTISAGTLILSGNNTAATGGVTISGGTLDINNATALGTGTFTITGGNIDDTVGTLVNSNNNVQHWNGNFTFNGTNSLDLGTGQVTMNASRTLTISANTLTVGGVITGAFSLTKNGSGTLNLTSTSSNYTGVTTINGGILDVSTLAAGGSVSGIGNSSAAATNLIINGGTLQYLGAAVSTDRLFTIGTLNATIDASGSGALNMNGTTSPSYSSTNVAHTMTLTGNNGGANTFAAPINNDGTGATTVVKSGTGEWVLTGNGNYTGGMTLNSGTLVINTNGTTTTGALGNNATLTIAGGNLDTTNASTNITTINAQNWNSDFTFVGTGNLNMSTGTVAMNASRTVTVLNNTLTVGGNISGTGFSLTKAGAGELVLSGNSSYTGGTNLSAGKLDLNNGGNSTTSAIGTGAFTLSGGVLDNTSGGTVVLATNNAENWNADFTFAGSNALNVGTGAVTMNASRIITVNASTLTIGGVISDGGSAYSLTLNGAGTLALNGADTFSGNMNLTNNNGTLVLGNVNALQNATLNYTSNTALTLATGTNVFAGLVGSSNIALGSNNITLNIGSGITDTYSGNISGTGNITKNGAGEEDFTGVNTYTGGTTINVGTLAFNGANTFTAGTVTLAGGEFDFNNASALGSNAVILTITSGTLDATNGTIVNSHTNAQHWNGNFTFAGTNSLDLGTGAVTMNASRTLTISANTLTVGGVISGTGFSLTKNGSGTLNLTSTSSNYSGATVINGGILSVSTLAAGGSVSSIGNSSAVAGNLTMNGGTLQYLGSGSATNRLFTIGVNGATLDASGSGALTMNATGSIAYTGTSISPTLTLTGNNAGANTLAAILANNGTGTTSLVKSGTGEWVLTGVNTYTGGTTISGGTLQIGNGTTNGVVVGNNTVGILDNAALAFAINATAQTYAGVISGTGNLTLSSGNLTLTGINTYTGGTTISGGTLQIGNGTTNGVVVGNSTVGILDNAALAFAINATAQTYAGNISGTGNLTLSSGNLTLTGNNSYTGGTVISGGLLEVSGNNALGGHGASSPVTVASGATLQLDNGFDTTGAGQTSGSSNGTLLTISGTGVGGNGALVNGNGTAEWQGNVALGANATIGSGSTASGCITVGNNLGAATSNISLTGFDLTFAGAATTTTNVTANITGTGNVNINTAGFVNYGMDGNGYSGTTNVINGTLILDTTDNSVPLSPGSGNLLAINGPLVIGDGVGGSNTAIVQMGATIPDSARYTISQNSSITVNQDGLFAVYGQDQTIGSLTMNGGNIDTTNHNNSISGLLGLNGNATILANANSSTISGNFNMQNSVGNTTTVFTVNSGGNVSGDLVINALLSGGSMVKNGSGNMVLTSNLNTYTGSTEVQAGTLNIQAANALGATDGSVGEGTTVDANAQLQLQGNIAVGNEYLTLNGNGTAGSDGALKNLSGNNSWNGTINAATNATINTTADSLYVSGNMTTAGTATVTFNGNGNTTISGNINGGLSLTKNGTGTLMLNGTTTNSYTGSTTVNAGTLELNKTANTNAVTGSTITINSGGTLLSDNSENVGSSVNMVLNGGTWTTNGASAASFTESLNTLTLTATSTLNLGANDNTVAYTNSSGTTWTGGSILYIDNWNGLLAGGGNDEVFFGTSAGGLGGTSSSGQLGEIIFVNPTIDGVAQSSNYHAIILSTGEVVPFLPAPEPGTVAAGAALGALALLRELRRRKNRVSVVTA